MEKKDKLQIMIELSDEILTELELNTNCLENILFKCTRLARLKNDFDAIKWFQLEISGYSKSEYPSGIKEAELLKYARKSNRTFTHFDNDTGKKEEKYSIYSVSKIESEIILQKDFFRNLTLPDSFQPTILKSSYHNMHSPGPTSKETVKETYSDVINKINSKKEQILDRVKNGNALLAKIKSSIYNFILNINLQLKFDDITESIFQKTKEIVDNKLLEISPKVFEKFVAASDRLKSNNPEEWSQAMSSCRNALKEFADYVFPPAKSEFRKKDGDSLVVTDDKYKNRLLAFIDKNTAKKDNKFLSARASDLIARIHVLNDLLSKGTHVGLTIEDIQICLLDTYLLIGSLISVMEIDQESKENSKEIEK